MYEVSVKTHFSAAHHLNDYSGDCSFQHGHNWDVEVFLRGENLNKSGMLMDFKDVKESLKSVVDMVDHKDLNTLDAFSDKSPTSENIAYFLYTQLSARINNKETRIHRVCVRETAGTGTSYWEVDVRND